MQNKRNIRHFTSPPLKRRDFLMSSVGAVAFLTGGALSGCGGGGGGSDPDQIDTNQDDPLTGKIIFSREAQAGQGDVVITDDTAGTGVKLTVPAAAVASPSIIMLGIRSGQHPAATPDLFASNPNCLELTASPDALSFDRPISVEIPWAAPYYLLGTAVYLREPRSGREIPIETAYDAGAKTLTGRIYRSDLRAVLGGEQKGPSTLQTFVSSTAITNGSGPDTRAARLPATITTASKTRSLPQSTKRRVAIVIHGLVDNAAGMEILRNYLWKDPAFQLKVDPSNAVDENGVPATGTVYDEVVSYGANGYNTVGSVVFSIKANARNFANWVRENYSGDEVVDIYAHSQGGLVARWAIEQEGLGSLVRQLVTLGTPHNGVPLRVLLGIFKYGSDLGAIKQLAAGAYDLLEGSEFLKELNGGPNAQAIIKTNYCTVAGTKYEEMKGQLGTIIEAIYQSYARKPGDPRIEHDGIVALSSANFLKEVPQAVVFQNHTELPGRPAQSNIEQWVVTKFSGTVE